MREAGGDGEEERVREQSRLLKEKIERAQGQFVEQTTGASRSGGDFTAMGRAMRLGTEFIAAILVGAVAGYLLDQWLNTSPWLLLVMVLIGFAAGVLNVVRAAGEMNRTAAAPSDSDLGSGSDVDKD